MEECPAVFPVEGFDVGVRLEKLVNPLNGPQGPVDLRFQLLSFNEEISRVDCGGFLPRFSPPADHKGSLREKQTSIVLFIQSRHAHRRPGKFEGPGFSPGLNLQYKILH